MQPDAEPMIQPRHRVQDAIRTDIVLGTLAPGSRITESALATTYGTSRVPVREALHALAAEGFVESRPYTGSRVCEIPVADAHDLFDIREVLEAAISRRAAERARAQFSAHAPFDGWSHTRRELARLLDAGDAAVEAGELGVLPALNGGFHLGIARLSGSTSLTVLLGQVTRKIEWLYAADRHSRGKRLWHDHRLIMAAIDSGDPDLAHTLMTDHVGAARSGYLSRFADAE